VVALAYAGVVLFGRWPFGPVAIGFGLVGSVVLGILRLSWPETPGSVQPGR
jgi:hypothetical protein